ncbi:MAG: hypothetical protein ABL872_12560 [Lacibacter sp.]
MNDLGYQRSLQERKLFIPEGITLITVKKKSQYGKITEELIVPKFTDKELEHAEDVIKVDIYKAKERFLKGELSTWDKEYKSEVKEASFSISPELICRDKKIISFCYGLVYSDNILMRPYGEYYSVNYDLVKNKLIKASDFFKVSSKKDSLELAKYILSALGGHAAEGEFNFSEIDFSMDDSTFYFFSDQYQFGTPFKNSGGIKKKYISKYVKEEYR